MGTDAAGNKYYENRVDYPFGQHRWVEPGDIHNFDSASVPPEWHGWMTSMNDAPPSEETAHIAAATKNVPSGCTSHVPEEVGMVGHQEETFHFHHLHNQTQVRSRGYGIGNPVVGLPPFVKDSYYTQPGSPYNDSSLEKKPEMIGDLDEEKGGGRPYKSMMWADRLKTPEERSKEEEGRKVAAERAAEQMKALEAKLRVARKARGGTVVGN